MPSPPEDPASQQEQQAPQHAPTELSHLLSKSLPENHRPEWDILLISCQKNNLERVRSLLTTGTKNLTTNVAEPVSPNHANVVGQSALHIAAWWGRAEICQVLIEAGANVHATNRVTGATPLHGVLQSSKSNMAGGRLDTLRYLVSPAGGADPQFRDQLNRIPLDYVDVEDPDFDAIVQIFLQSEESSRPPVFDLLGQCGRDHCHFSAAQPSSSNITSGRAQQHQDQPGGEQSFSSLSDFLLQLQECIHRDPNEKKNPLEARYQGRTPLLYWIHLLLQEAINEKGAENDTIDNNESGITNQQGQNITSYLQVLQFLLDQGADAAATMALQDQGESDLPPESDPDQYTALDLISDSILQLYKEHKSIASIQTASTSLAVAGKLLFQVPPLLFAAVATSNLKKCCTQDDCGRSSTVASTSASTSITTPQASTNMSAMIWLEIARRNYLELGHLWKEWKIPPYPVTNRQGMTPLQFAARSGHCAMVELLLQVQGEQEENGDGTNSVLDMLYHSDKRGKTALDAAKANQKKAAVELLERALQR